MVIKNRPNPNEVFPNPNIPSLCFIAYPLSIKWWDWEIEKIEAIFEALSSGDLTLIRGFNQ